MCVNKYLLVKVLVNYYISESKAIIDLAPQIKPSFSSGSVRSCSASILWTRNVKFGRKVSWYRGNVLYTCCETPLKSKEVTSLGKTQSELTAQIDSRLSIVDSQKHEGAECRLSPQDGLGTFPCRLPNLFTARAGAVRQLTTGSGDPDSLTSLVSDNLRPEEIKTSSNFLNFRDS